MTAIERNENKWSKCYLRLVGKISHNLVMFWVWLQLNLGLFL